MEQTRCSCIYELGKRTTPPMVYCPTHDESNQPEKIDVTYNEDSWRIEVMSTGGKSLYGESGENVAPYTKKSSKWAAMRRAGELLIHMDKTALDIPVHAEYWDNIKGDY